MKQFLGIHIRLIAGIAVVLVGCGAARYVVGNEAPTFGSYVVGRSNVFEALDEPGTVASENKANLSFQEGGQIARVYVKEGDAVTAGTALAELNSASLEANLEQAKAALAASVARLDELQIGATPQTIAVSQATLNSAKQALANGYTGVPNTLSDAYSKANDAVRTQLATFFSSPESYNPQLIFQISDSQVFNNINSARLSASVELNTWQNELASTTANPTSDTFDANLQSAAKHLSIIQNLMTLAVIAATDQVGLQTSVSPYKVSAVAGANEVNSAVAEISNVSQAIASEKAAVSQTQAQLNLTTASSTAQNIQEQEGAVAQARAVVTAAQVALNHALLAAPFPGTVQNLTAQVGQVVSAGSPVLSLVNNTGLKIQTYVSEADVARINVGDKANVTLDAFGIDMNFPAILTTIDSAETQVNGTPVYLATLHFTSLEPQVKSGMTGNVHIFLTADENVIAAPSRLVLNNGSQYFVLVKTSGGIVQKNIEIGPAGDSGMTEILSGLSEGDVLANF